MKQKNIGSLWKKISNAKETYLCLRRLQTNCQSMFNTLKWEIYASWKIRKTLANKIADDLLSFVLLTGEQYPKRRAA